MVVFNVEVTHAARFALKITAAFDEEPKKNLQMIMNNLLFGVQKLDFSAKIAKFHTEFEPFWMP